MKRAKRLFPVLSSASIALLAACASGPQRYNQLDPNHPAVASVERYTVSIPKNEMLPYSGLFSGSFPEGLPLAPGSGIAFSKREADGTLVFIGLSDRGPNGDSPNVQIGSAKPQISKVFMTPSFVPRLAEIRVKSGEQASVTRTMPLRVGTNNLSGLPLPADATGSSGEAPLSDALKVIPTSIMGIDPEGVAVDKGGNLWIVDEYGPFLTQVSPDGNVLKQYAPSLGLPMNLAARQPNRGFEGVAITPNGKIYAAVQSTLDVDGKTKHSAQFIRIVEFDPATRAVRQLAYPLDLDAYKRPGDVKLGDLVAIDNSRFLLIDQGNGKSGMRNVIYVIDIEGATDISTLKTAGSKELEYATAAELASVKMIRKQLVLDMRALGWKAEKAEGLALVDGGFVIINDNDFGLKASISGGKGEDLGNYTANDGKLNDNGKYVVSSNGEGTELWIVKLKQPLSAFFPK